MDFIKLPHQVLVPSYVPEIRATGTPCCHLCHCCPPHVYIIRAFLSLLPGCPHRVCTLLGLRPPPPTFPSSLRSSRAGQQHTLGGASSLLATHWVNFSWFIRKRIQLLQPAYPICATATRSFFFEYFGLRLNADVITYNSGIIVLDCMWEWWEVLDRREEHQSNQGIWYFSTVWLNLYGNISIDDMLIFP